MSLLPLKPGARIAVCAPAGIPDGDGLHQGVQLLRSWGFDPACTPHVGATSRYLAGSDSQRFQDLAGALQDPHVDAVWMARGGYGLTRLLPRLAKLRWDPRPVLGFSDGTALLALLWNRGLAGGIHAPVVHSLTRLPDRETLESLRGLLDGAAGGWWPGRTWSGGSAEGPLVGGNLCVLASLAGSGFALDTAGTILLLEDVGERPYRLDRMLTQLEQSGAFREVRGIVVGALEGCRPPAGADWTAEQVVRESLAELGVPVLGGVPVGHGRRNLPFVYGAPARIDGDGLRWWMPG